MEGATTYAARVIPAVFGIVRRPIREVHNVHQIPKTTGSQVPDPEMQKKHELFLMRRIKQKMRKRRARREVNHCRGPKWIAYKRAQYLHDIRTGAQRVHPETGETLH